MGSGSYQLLLLVGAGCIVGAYSQMYISNATDILYTANLVSQPKSIYHNSNSRIVGVAEDDGYVFWSDIGYDSRGIYRASVSGLNQVTDVMKIVSDDVGEVNGLAVDWLKKHIYWTDSTKLSIEVAKYDGSVRHVLPISGLKTPRGIAVDPENGYLYWNDQGTKKIEQSFLDGSSIKTIAESSVGTTGPNLPNQMIVKGRKLYYVDAYNLNVVEYDVSQSTPVRRVVAANLRDSGASSSSYPYGLDLDDVYVYVSIGFTGKVVQMPLNASAPPTALFQNLGVDAIFSLTGVSSKPTTSSPSCSCSGGICLQNSTSTSRCVCQSLGNDSPKTSSANKQACQTPKNVLFYVIAETGVVGYRDLEGPSDDKNLYIVGRSSRPVAVTYDPVTQFVYWSDVQERSVHKAKINGANHSIFMNSFTHSLGVVDGLVMDPVNRNLYYTNMGSVEVQSFVHRWHKIELINLDGKGRKTIVESAEKPRGLYVDDNANKLYYTDWGDKPAVVQVNLDGSNPEAIRTSGLDNPNAVTIIGDWIYVADSHYKTRDSLNQKYPRSSRNGAVYKVKKDGTMWQEVSSFNPKTPFGMTSFDNHLYVSDWDSKSIQKVSTAGSFSTFIQSFNTPMSVYFSKVIASPSSNPCSSLGCSELCILGQTEKCTCDSYNANTSPSASSKTCAIPGQFILVGDFNAIKLVSQDGTATPGTTHLVEPQAAIAGSSYFANFVALAYNTATGQLYYSDVNRMSIYESKLDGKDPKLVYNGSQIADGMDLHGGKLYWTAFTEGKIYSTDLSTNQTSVVISGLSRPRAIKVAKSRIYWSEWGTRPRVASVPLLNTADITTHTDNVIRPNGIDVDDRIYIGDGNPINPHFLSCPLTSGACNKVLVSGAAPKHIFALKKYNRNIFYTDWISGTLSMLNLDQGNIIHLANNLMRPTDIALNIQSDKSCSGSHGCDQQCTPYPGGYFCSCPATQSLDTDGKTCIATDPYATCFGGECNAQCSSSQVCAKKVGEGTCGCVCKPGYYGSSCQQCQAGFYKPYKGDQACSQCPQGATTSTTGKACTCSNQNVWDWKSQSCSSSSGKLGTCPTTVFNSSCSSGCTADKQCNQASKCCSSNAVCFGSAQVCVDPKPSGQFTACVHNGIVYSVGDSFKPTNQPCITCRCTRDKTYGNPQYGYAECDLEICPELPCDTNSQVISTDQCCPQCKTTCASHPIVINNCDSGVLDEVRNLGPQDYAVEFALALTARDNCKMDRKITITPSPSQKIYNWKNAAYSISANATATGSNSQMDTFTCNVRLKVNDVTKPQIQCPPSSSYTENPDKPEECVFPPNPTVSDNVCGQGEEFPECNLETIGCAKLGKTGKVTLTYVARDGQGNEAQCSTDVEILAKPQISCTVPPINYGVFKCDQQSKDNCMIECSAGYESTLIEGKTQYSCGANGAWTSPLPDQLQTKACTKRQSIKLIGTSRLMSLPCPIYPKNIIELGIKQQISGNGYARNTNLYNVNTPIGVEVRASGCDETSKTMRIDIDLIAELSNDALEASIKDGIQNILAKINSDFESGVLAPWAGADPPKTKPEKVSPSRGCLKGQIERSNGCYDCPAGTMQKDSQCIPCGKHTYNEKPRDIYCYPCPDGKVTRQSGTQLKQLCVDSIAAPAPQDEEGSGMGMIIGIVVGAVVVIVIIVIIVVVVMKARGFKPEKSDSSFGNPTFEGEEKHYTDLGQVDAKVESPYDNLDKSKGSDEYMTLP